MPGVLHDPCDSRPALRRRKAIAHIVGVGIGVGGLLYINLEACCICGWSFESGCGLWLVSNRWHWILGLVVFVILLIVSTVCDLYTSGPRHMRNWRSAFIVCCLHLMGVAWYWMRVIRNSALAGDPTE